MHKTQNQSYKNYHVFAFNVIVGSHQKKPRNLIYQFSIFKGELHKSG